MVRRCWAFGNTARLDCLSPMSSRFLGVAVGQELHGALQVGKEHRDLLAFAFEGTAGGEDLLRQVGGGVGQRGTH